MTPIDPWKLEARYTAGDPLTEAEMLSLGLWVGLRDMGFINGIKVVFAVACIKHGERLNAKLANWKAKLPQHN